MTQMEMHNLVMGIVLSLRKHAYGRRVPTGPAFLLFILFFGNFIEFF